MCKMHAKISVQRCYTGAHCSETDKILDVKTEQLFQQ